MNTQATKPEPDFGSELKIQISGQLLSRAALETVVEHIVRVLVKQLLADPALKSAACAAAQAQARTNPRTSADGVRMLTIEQAAERLGIRPVTVRSWISARKIPMVKVGRCVRVRADAVQHFIESNTIPAR